jgi:hypothetical protein
MFLLALLLQHFDKTLWLKCHIQWLYLAVHGCKTYLNLNLNRAWMQLLCYSTARVYVRGKERPKDRLVGDAWVGNGPASDTSSGKCAN